MNNFETLNLGEVKPKIVTGGKEGKFVPNLNVSFHSDEFFLNINRKDKIITTETAIQLGDKVKLSGKDTDVFYIDEKGNYKWDIEFQTKPETNFFKWEINSKGLDFYYQPELTDEEIKEGHIRPENIIGSYAVYCNKRNNKYKAGKVCHIDRPLCIDSKGLKCYADIYIDDKYKTLTIIIPQKYIDEASYPMTLDPTIGFAGTPNSAGYTTNVAILSMGLASGSLVAPSSGTCSIIHVYVPVGANGFAGYPGVYDNNGSPNYNLLSTVSFDAWVTGWNTITIPSFNIVQGNNYHPCFGSGAEAYFGYDTTTGNTSYRSYVSTLPANWTETTPRAFVFGVYLSYVETSSYSGILKRWNGSAWVKEPLKYWNGSSWATKPLKRYNGSAWVSVDITGV